MEKLDKPVEKTPEEQKERVGKVFESRGVGRPKGEHKSKREQYLKMLNEQRIKQPKQQTLEFYRIFKESDRYVLKD